MMTCYNDIILNRQFYKKQLNYHLKNICACSDIGKQRNRQEDSILVLENPLDNDIKIIAVADGMGGLSNGGKASNIALLNLAKWFLYDLKCNNNLNNFIDKLKIMINEIDIMIRNNCNGGGTTLSTAIILKNNTIFINIGDSRIYIKNNNNFFQLSKDHSIVWDMYEKGEIINKDDMRFHKKNNLITSRLGCESKRLKIDFNILDNLSYDDIFPFTDGVTDCLSDDVINKIVEDNSHADISRVIVKNAISTNSYNLNLNPDEYYNEIYGGKDNSSAVVFSKKMDMGGNYDI